MLAHWHIVLAVPSLGQARTAQVGWKCLQPCGYPEPYKPIPSLYTAVLLVSIQTLHGIVCPFSCGLGNTHMAALTCFIMLPQGPQECWAVSLSSLHMCNAAPNTLLQLGRWIGRKIKDRDRMRHRQTDLVQTYPHACMHMYFCTNMYALSHHSQESNKLD